MHTTGTRAAIGALDERLQLAEETLRNLALEVERIADAQDDDAPVLFNTRVGEYQGLAGLRHGFAAVFTLRAPQAKNGPTDIFSARIGPGDEHDHR